MDSCPQGDTKIGTHAYTHPHTPHWPSGGGVMWLICANSVCKQVLIATEGHN